MDRTQQGGLWNSAPAQYSSQTHQLLKDMMQESKLTNLQMRRVNDAMRSGSTLPQRLPPTSSAKKSANSDGRKPKPPKVLNPKNYQSSLRSRDQIEASGAYEQPQYRPAPQQKRDLEKEKRRLANLMAFGEDCAPAEGANRSGSRRMTLDPPEPEVEVDRFDELAEEVADRRKFLEKMEAAGQGAKYRAKIQAEISQMIREMELIDRKRNQELQRLLQQQQQPSD